MATLRGYVKSIDRRTGYGFIRPHNSAGADVFFHIQTVHPHKSRAVLEPGDGVRYTTIETSRGLKADRVEVGVKFTQIALPDYCSHRLAVRNDRTGEVEVFSNPDLAPRWIAEQREIYDCDEE